MFKKLRLVTKRLLLRDYEMSDKKVTRELLDDLDVTRFLSVVPHPYTESDADVFLKMTLKNREKKPREEYNLVVTDKETNEFLGAVGISSINELDKSATMGYWLGKRHWRNSYMTEVVLEIIRFAFEELKLRRINISAAVENDASNALIKKVGFVYEGTRKQYMTARSTGKIHDANIYGMLKSDWKS